MQANCNKPVRQGQSGSPSVGERAIQAMHQRSATHAERDAVTWLFSLLLNDLHKRVAELVAEAYRCPYAAAAAHKRLVRLTAAAMSAAVASEAGASGAQRVLAVRPRQKPRRGLLSALLFRLHRRPAA